MRSRTGIYLDSEELIGSREDIVAGSLDRYRVDHLGVSFHEVGHAKHKAVGGRLRTKARRGWPEVLARDRTILEEPRMEAHTVGDYPELTARGGFIRRGLSA